MKMWRKNAAVENVGKVCMESHNEVNAAEYMYIVCSFLYKT